MPEESFPNQLMTPAQMEALLNVLNERTSGTCTRCNKAQWSLQPGFGQIHLQPLSRDIHLGGGPMIPVVYVVCGHCGLTNTHALGSLGLMDHPEFNIG